MSLSAILDSFNKQLDSNNNLLIGKSSASHGHEEAMLWEEPVEDESQVEEKNAIISTTIEGWGSGLEAIKVEGVTLPATTTLTVNDQPISLFRNGHGVRTVRAPFGINLHVYVATLYTQQPIRSEEDVEELWEDGNGFVMEFTFLREVSPSQMSIAWNYQLDSSVTDADYDNYAADREAFLKLLDGSMVKGGIIRFDFQPDRLILTNQGQVVGEIEGRNFQKAFASMWFGSQPVMEEIKAGLLKGGSVVGARD